MLPLPLPLPLLLLLLGSSCRGGYMGSVVSYYPKNMENEKFKVILRTKRNYAKPSSLSYYSCFGGSCFGSVSQQDFVITAVNEDWSQTEQISTYLVPTNAPFQIQLFNDAWVSNRNNVTSPAAPTRIEPRNRSDTNRANTSPLTTVLPLLRVPSNCQRDFRLSSFDPDGDDVRCRYGLQPLSECDVCTPAYVLTLSPACTLSFSPSSPSGEGRYAVQVMMEDFPLTNITLTQNDGSQEEKTTSEALSKVPVQFLLQVDPAVPSCSEGLYLPEFLPPTPADGALLYAAVNQPLNMTIKARALYTTVSELLFSGPGNINLKTLEAGTYIMSWTPSGPEDGGSFPVCFVALAVTNSTEKYHSELRCVVVNVGNAVASLNLRISTSASFLSDVSVRNAVVQQVRDELVRRGMSSFVTLRLVSLRIV